MRMTVRIPDDITAKLKEEAKQEERSINGQLVHVLRQHYKYLAGQEVMKKSTVEILPAGSPQKIEKGAK